MVAEIGHTLGTPLIPWQQYVADVAGERRPDGSYEYEIVIVSVPRQTGKTTLIRAVGILRALMGRDFFYTAQTGKDARARWYDLVKILRVTDAFKHRIKIALRGGSEHVEMPGGGVFQVFAPTPESLHGYTPPTVCIDEAFAQTAAGGELLMGAIEPAQFTIVDKQVWLVSTRGTADSTFFHDWIDRAMEGTPRVALFLWGATDDQSVFSLDDIAAFHPGVGFKLGGKQIAAADVLSASGKVSRAEYERAYGNRATATSDQIIPTEVWRPLCEDVDLPESWQQVTVTYDVGLDRRGSSIVATWLAPDGKIVGKLLAAAPGITWLADAVEKIGTARRPAKIAAAAHGPVLEVTAELHRRGVKIDEVAEREFATACGHFLTLVETAGLRPDTTEQLEKSVTGLVTRTGVVDGVAFSRRHSVGDASAGIGLTLGCWLTRNRNTGTPTIRF